VHIWESINVKLVGKRCNRSYYKCSARSLLNCLEGEVVGAMKLWGSFHMTYMNMNDDDLYDLFLFELCKVNDAFWLSRKVLMVPIRRKLLACSLWEQWQQLMIRRCCIYHQFDMRHIQKIVIKTVHSNVTNRNIHGRKIQNSRKMI